MEDLNQNPGSAIKQTKSFDILQHSKSQGSLTNNLIAHRNGGRISSIHYQEGGNHNKNSRLSYEGNANARNKSGQYH